MFFIVKQLKNHFFSLGKCLEIVTYSLVDTTNGSDLLNPEFDSEYFGVESWVPRKNIEMIRRPSSNDEFVRLIGGLSNIDCISEKNIDENR